MHEEFYSITKTRLKNILKGLYGFGGRCHRKLQTFVWIFNHDSRVPVQLYLEHQTWSRANLNMTFYVVVSVYRLV